MYTMFILAAILFSPSSSGQAYLDPGSGSFILQLIVASLLGGLFLIKTYWQKIISFFRKGSEKGEDKTEE